jgi:phage tail sheath protein FI
MDTTGTTGPTNSQLKFTVPFQGGDDGIAPYTPIFTGAETTKVSDMDSTYTGGTNLYGFDLSGTSKNGYIAYKKALDILSNQDEYDINMIALPGVIKQIHSSVTNAAIDMVEERGDAFYVMDLTRVDASVNTAVNQADGLDTNYAAVYYPWVKVLGASNRPILVPPSVIVPGAIAASDKIAAEWFAPAGLNRGVLGNVIEAKIRLNQSERDTLYDAKINPIATFPQTGVCIWGQKTLQERSTALDRINVRRLLIALKKFIASSSRYLVFEQNTLQTRTRFLNIVNPYLESVQQRQGLFAFRVQMDEQNNTPDVIDRNQLIGAIYLQPTKTAEFIVLDFNVLPTGATFDNGGNVS